MGNKDYDRHTTLFHDRIEPIIEIYPDESNPEHAEHFGRIMLAAFKYSMYGEIIDLDNPYDNAFLKQIRSQIDIAREGSRKFNLKQAVNSNLRVATSKDDMKKRMQAYADSVGGISKDEIQSAVDRFSSKESNEIKKGFKGDDVQEAVRKAHKVGIYSD